MDDARGDGGFPEPKIDRTKVQECGRVYEDLLGYLPPRQQARIDQLSRLDPEFLAVQEEMRKLCMYPEAFDQKTVQLMLWGMLLITLRDAARIHGIAARRAGATWEEMQAVINLAFLFGGFSVANRSAQQESRPARLNARDRAPNTGLARVSLLRALPRREAAGVSGPRRFPPSLSLKGGASPSPCAPCPPPRTPRRRPRAGTSRAGGRGLWRRSPTGPGPSGSRRSCTSS